MIRVRENKRRIDAILVLLLFAVFSVCILMVLLTGANVYRRLSDRDRIGYDQRTAAQYLTTRIRQADREGAVSVETFADCTALCLTEEIDGVTYETRVYCYDGYLRELFSADGGDFLPEDGEKVMPADDFQVCFEESGLQIRILTEERWQELRLYLRSERGAVS